MSDSFQRLETRKAPAATSKTRLPPTGSNSNSRSREAVPRALARNPGSSQKRLNSGVNAHRYSTGSFNSNKQVNEDTLNVVRNSFDNQAISELRNFIQNSDKKTESYCSIQLTSAFNQPKGKREQSNGHGGAAHGLTANDSQHQIVVQVHNGSALKQNIASPAAQ